jgi:NAD(P)-dependent dehydrogenase (short-subunit alcohol dehydrogenase family)
VKLADKTVLVTGAGSGIGRAIAIRFAAEGAHVVLADLSPGPLWDPLGSEPTADVITSAGGSAEFVAADLTTSEEVERAVTVAVASDGRLDAVVNCAGIVGSSSLLETSDEEWDRFIRVNLRSQFLVCRATIGRMIEQEPVDEIRGRVVNITSQLGVTAPPGRLAYAVSKAAGAHLTRQLAVDYARHGILVNAVAPGHIITGTHDGDRDYLEHGTTNEAIEYSLSRTPYSRLGRADDVTGAALFLVSDDCTFVSGHNLMVDGGWTAY